MNTGATAPSWYRVGSAVRGAKPGVFTVDIRGSRLSVEHMQAESLRLGESDRDHAGAGHSVMEVVQSGGAVRVCVAEFADPVEPTLWLHQQPPTFLVDALIEGIAGITDERLAGALARGELGGELHAGEEMGNVLLPAQHLAYRACLGRGLWAVWGPPGTGKTSVLTRAIGDLIASGRRVLLVSATNIAVDNVVVKLEPMVRGTPGRVVRVGTPHLREVADNAEVSLSLLVRSRLDELERLRTGVAAELTALGTRQDRRVKLSIAVAGFDYEKFQRAEQRLRDPAFGAESLSVALSKARELLAAATDAAAAADAAVDLANRRDAAVASDRDRWREIDACEREAEALRAEIAKHDFAVATARSDAEAAARCSRELDGGSAVERFRSRKTRAAAAAEQARLESDLAWYAEQRAAFAESAELRIDYLRREAERLTTATTVDRRETIRISEELRAATAARVRTAAERARLERESGRLEREYVLTKTASDEVAAAHRAGLPVAYADLQVLLLSAEADDLAAERLTKQHRELEERFRVLAQDAQGEIIRAAHVVATTLARFRTNSAVLTGPYDVVLVDEAGAAALPEVLLAVSVARSTAVLLGDFMQLGPVFAEELTGTDRADIRRWLLSEVFAHCRIESPRAALADPGCIALDTQHRFGRHVMELANRIAYDGMLRAGPVITARPDTDVELVLVDTDGLTDLGHVYRTGARSGWWPAGVLLARAIAEMHADEGTTIGVVTPYAIQAEVTLEAMRDVEAEGAMIAEVGTAHRFQGREFGIVVFDLVESADDALWMAKAGRGPNAGEFGRNGLRLFNVGVTRVQQRVYFLGSRSRIREASPETALGQLGAMMAERKVRNLAATDLIAPLARSEVLGPVGSRLAEVLARHVEISDVQDEISFYETFADRLGTARESVWIWAPWVAKRLRALLPALVAAAERGVRIIVFVRDPGDQLQQRFEELVADLAAVVHTVVRVHQMHQKIVVVDEQLVILGSLNPLSQSSTREVMLTMHGRHFAARILRSQHAQLFARPPTCAGCRRKDVDLKRRQNGNWYWRCRNVECPARRKNRAWIQDVNLDGATSGPGRARRR